MAEVCPRLCDLRVPESCLSLKESKIGVISKKIWKFDGQLGDELRGRRNRSFFRLHFDKIMVKVQKNITPLTVHGMFMREISSSE